MEGGSPRIVNMEYGDKRHVEIYVCTFVCHCMCVCVCVCVRVHVCACVHVPMYVYVCTHACIHYAFNHLARKFNLVTMG